MPTPWELAELLDEYVALTALLANSFRIVGGARSAQGTQQRTGTIRIATTATAHASDSGSASAMAANRMTMVQIMATATARSKGTAIHWSAVSGWRRWTRFPRRLA
jgi:hypothetical protein